VTATPPAHRTQGRGPGSRLIALYPAAWRRRYGDELASVLEVERLTMADRVDLVRGAIDAHLHPNRPSPLPAVAALTAGAIWTAHAIALATQPVPLDWPGYLFEALPLALLGVAVLGPAMVGLWLRVGDDDGAIGRLGLVIGIAGLALWFVALLAASLGIDYGAGTAIAATVAMVGTAMVGLALAGRRSPLLGGLVAGAALAGVAPPGIGWPLFGAAWSAIGIRFLLDFRDRLDHQGGRTFA
jgi:hypothetical protein